MGVVALPLAYVVTSFALDLAMFVIIGLPFPIFYTVSLLLLVVWATLVSCIPNRWVQFGIFFVCITIQTIITIVNLITFNNLYEIFI